MAMMRLPALSGRRFLIALLAAFRVFGVIGLALLVLQPAVLSASPRAKSKRLVLANSLVRRELAYDGYVWRTAAFARADGSDALDVQSDEFHALLLDGQELTLDQYQAAGDPNGERRGDIRQVMIHYVPRKGVTMPAGAPSAITMTYSLGDGPYLRKTVVLEMKEGQAIDRLEVERFSVSAAASRGGRGEPVFVGNTWFFGVEYPAFYSRHTDGNTPATFSGPYDRLGNYSYVDLEGKDVDRHPRPGLIRLMHFPGYAAKLSDGTWGITGKTAIAGIGRKGDSIELAFLNYLNTIRRPVRSYIHYNNWFSREGRDISVHNFVDNFFLRFKENLAPYGVGVDAMVMDDGWQNKKSIYDVNPTSFPRGMDDVAALSQSLRQAGTNLGIWIALNGYGSDIDWGKANGYTEAERNQHFSRFRRYYSISNPKYNAKLRERLTDMITRGQIQYIKHDFNEMSDLGGASGHIATDRHGHEAEVDAEIELLRMERELNKDIYQNITNWIWFSPWWLAHGNNLWMLSSDSGEFRDIPELSTLVMAADYRDVNLYRAWHDPATRPLVPISHLMTHGIIYTESKYSSYGDTLHEFADYVMLYYMRGLQLKEWYINPRILSKEQWEVLGRATRWSQEHVQTLANSVLVGGDPRKGEPYGYICWNGEEGILSVRNPRPGQADISVPFDATAWYRGAAQREFRASIVYPYQGEWPATFHSGQPIRLTVPGNTLMVLHLRPGHASESREPILSRIDYAAEGKDGQVTARLRIPDKDMQRCELVLISHAGKPEAALDDQTLAASRTNQGKGWQIASFDLQKWRGREVRLRIPAENAEAWLVLDRPVADVVADRDPRLPYPVAHGYRRQTVQLVPIQ